MYINTIEKICHKDKDVRLKNICGLIRRPYRLQTDRRNTNIIIPAKKPEHVIVLTAHYDVYPKSMGYNDNGSGIATVLSIMDHVPDDVEIVFTDNEEVGGWGSQLYIAENRNRIRMNINVDVVGLGTKIYYDMADPVFEIHHQHSIFLENSYGPVSYSGVPFNDSHIFRNNSIPTVLIIAGSAPFSGIISEVWKHQHRNVNDDVLGLLSESGMLKVSSFILDTLLLNTATKYRYEDEGQVHAQGLGAVPA